MCEGEGECECRCGWVGVSVCMCEGRLGKDQEAHERTSEQMLMGYLFRFFRSTRRRRREPARPRSVGFEV